MARKGSEHSSQTQARMMKDRKIERTTGQCPWGCGRSLTNGGDALLNHLLRCKGSPKQVRRQNAQV